MKVISPKALSHLSLPCILKYFLEWRGRRAWRRCSRNSSYLTAFFVSHSRIRVCLWEPTAYVSLVSHAHQNLCIHQCLAQRPAGKNCKSHWLNLPRCLRLMVLGLHIWLSPSSLPRWWIKQCKGIFFSALGNCGIGVGIPCALSINRLKQDMIQNWSDHALTQIINLSYLL